MHANLIHLKITNLLLFKISNSANYQTVVFYIPHALFIYFYFFFRRDKISLREINNVQLILCAADDHINHNRFLIELIILKILVELNQTKESMDVLRHQFILMETQNLER